MSRDVDLDTERLMLIDLDVGAPVFTVSEVAKIFFNEAPSWLRWREGSGLTYNGMKIGKTRVGNSRRLYTLRDVEMMTHALAGERHLDYRQVRQTIRAVKAIAQIHGYIK